MKKCIKCDKDLQCDAEYCNECGALQWEFASMVKFLIKVQQVVINFLMFFIISVLLYVAAFYKNNISSTDKMSLGLVSSAILLFIMTMIYNIIIVRLAILPFGNDKKQLKNQEKSAQ